MLQLQEFAYVQFTIRYVNCRMVILYKIKYISNLTKNNIHKYCNTASHSMTRSYLNDFAINRRVGMPHPPVVPPLPADQINYTAVCLTQHVVYSKHPIGGQGWHQFTIKQRPISQTLFATKERHVSENISCNQQNIELRTD